MNFYEVSTHISLFGSISEIRESDLQNYVVLNTGTVGTGTKVSANDAKIIDVSLSMELVVWWVSERIAY